MHVKLHVHSLEFYVPIGEGSQNFKWLGLVAAQRYALLRPHGRSRTRETAHTKVGLYLPASVSLESSGHSSTEVMMNPQDRLRDHVVDGEVVHVTLQHEMTVDETGAPERTPWSVAAFYTKARRDSEGGGEEQDGEGTEDREDRSNSDEHDQTTNSNNLDEEEAQAGDRDIDDQVASQMEATRVQRVMIGRLDTREEIHAAVCYDFELMQLEDIEPNVGERGEIESVLTEDFEPLHGLFRHYTSSSSQEQQLSYLAFCHLVHESELFHLEEDAKILSKVFRAAAGKSSPSLSRGAFFEAVIRLAKVWHQLCQSNNEQELSTSTVLYRVIDKFLLPLYNLLMTGTDTRRALGHPKIQNLMHEYHDKLTRCFVKCQEVAPSRDMTAEVLTKLIRDSGMLCPIDSNEHERVIQAAMEESFSGFQSGSQEVSFTYSEFIEVISNLALKAWKTQDLSNREILSTTFDTIVSASKHFRFEQY